MPARGTTAATEGAGESEGGGVAQTSGNGLAPGPDRAKAARVDTNFLEGTMPDTLISAAMSPSLGKVAARARQEPQAQFHALAYLIDRAALERAYHRQRQAAAVGVDEITKEQYGQNLEANLQELHERLRTGRYRDSQAPLLCFCSRNQITPPAIPPPAAGRSAGPPDCPHGCSARSPSCRSRRWSGWRRYCRTPLAPWRRPSAGES